MNDEALAKLKEARERMQNPTQNFAEGDTGETQDKVAKAKEKPKTAKKHIQDKKPQDEHQGQAKGVISFISKKGFGFIQPKGSTERKESLYFHASNTLDKFDNLKKGNKVTFTKKDKKALKVKAE